jgi:hypothetical protein
VRKIHLPNQIYGNFGLINKVSYSILPFDGNNFPVDCSFYLDRQLVGIARCHITEEQFNDYSKYESMDEKIFAQLGLTYTEQVKFEFSKYLSDISRKIIKSIENIF